MVGGVNQAPDIRGHQNEVHWASTLMLLKKNAADDTRVAMITTSDVANARKWLSRSASTGIEGGRNRPAEGLVSHHREAREG